MYLFISGLPCGEITDKQLIVWYILFAVLSVVFFVLCERKINGKDRVHNTKTSELSNLGSNIHPKPANNKSMSLSTPIVKNDSEQSVSLQIEPTIPLYKDESIFERLKRLCNPVNYMDNYDKDNVAAANILYSELLSDNPDIMQIATRAENNLGLKLVDDYQIEDLKSKLHPKTFMNPYDAQKLALANELYSRISEPVVNYSDYVDIVSQAKPILDFWAEREKLEKLKRDQEERERLERAEKERLEKERFERERQEREIIEKERLLMEDKRMNRKLEIMMVVFILIVVIFLLLTLK